MTMNLIVPIAFNGTARSAHAAVHPVVLIRHTHSSVDDTAFGVAHLGALVFVRSAFHWAGHAVGAGGVQRHNDVGQPALSLFLIT